MPRKRKVKIQKAGRFPGLSVRLAKGVGAVAAVAAGVCGLVWGFQELGASVATHPDYVVSRDELELAAGPSWMTPAMLAELDLRTLDPEFPATFSLLDPAVCARLAAAYARSPWVERVERVVKHDPRFAARAQRAAADDPEADPPRALEVQLVFRRPLAFVERAGGLALVDEKGVRLPGTYREPRLRPVGATEDLSLLVITGVRSAPPEPGRRWDDATVEAGVKVARGLAPRRARFDLAKIDVSNVGYRQDSQRSEVAVYTSRGTEIRWGKAPTRQAALLEEKTVGEKVGFLDYVYQRFGGLDGRFEYIDVPNHVYKPRATPPVHRLRS